MSRQVKAQAKRGEIRELPVGAPRQIRGLFREKTRLIRFPNNAHSHTTLILLPSPPHSLHRFPQDHPRSSSKSFH